MPICLPCNSQIRYISSREESGGWGKDGSIFTILLPSWRMEEMATSPPLCANLRSEVSAFTCHHGTGINNLKSWPKKSEFLLHNTCPLYVGYIPTCRLHSGTPRDREAFVWNVTITCGRRKENVVEWIWFLKLPLGIPICIRGQNRSYGQVWHHQGRETKCFPPLPGRAAKIWKTNNTPILSLHWDKGRSGWGGRRWDQ